MIDGSNWQNWAICAYWFSRKGKRPKVEPTALDALPFAVKLAIVAATLYAAVKITLWLH